MQPNTEPSTTDVAAVAAAMGQPAQQQPETPTPQPTPSQQPAQPTAPADPFAAFTAPPAEPAQPQPQEVQPTQQPVQQAAPAPQAVEPGQPQAQPAQPAPAQTYDQYLESIGAAPAQQAAIPDMAQVDPADPEAVKSFFDDLVNTAVQRAESQVTRRENIRTAENSLWNAAMDTYPTLRTNTELRGMVHNIRMAEFQRGVAITPTQAAENLLAALGSQYRQGVADQNVVTTIESVQPNGGGTQQVATGQGTADNLLAVQDGGEQALMGILDKAIKNNTL